MTCCTKAFGVTVSSACWAATRSCALFFVLSLGSQMLAAQGANGAPPDAVLRFLSERGLLDTEVPDRGELGLAPRVRDVASDRVITAMNFLGVPYKLGGNSVDEGFDCSGFTRYVFKMSMGFVLPRRSEEQAAAPGLIAVKRDEIKPGDLVFFNTLARSFSHVGIYVGEGKFIHAPRSGAAVRVEDMRYAYWAKRYTGARRVAETASVRPSVLEPLPVAQ